jgi:hypothetical protein
MQSPLILTHGMVSIIAVFNTSRSIPPPQDNQIIAPANKHVNIYAA